MLVFAIACLVMLAGSALAQIGNLDGLNVAKTLEQLPAGDSIKIEVDKFSDHKGPVTMTLTGLAFPCTVSNASYVLAPTTCNGRL